MSIVVRVAGRDDLAAADRLLQAAFERPTSFAAHLGLHCRIEPERFWVADDGGQLAGTIGVALYLSLGAGPVAYIGLMAVDPARQRQGIARRLVSFVLERLDAAGCEVALLDATDKGAPLYEQFGFVDDAEAVVFERVDSDFVGPSRSAMNVAPADALREIQALDGPAFGADRGKLLGALWSEHRQRCLVARGKDGAAAGYLFVREPTLGPWVAVDAAAAEALLAAALRLRFVAPPHVLVPRSNVQAQELLARYGFVERRRLRHMRRGGTASPGRPERLFGQSSFAHG
jgi:predicted N-acetyltransferase YhbS